MSYKQNAKTLPENFNQVCVMMGTIVGEEKINDFVEYMKNEMNVRIHYLEEIATNPDKDNFGNKIEGTGGRNDVFFAIHDEDVARFAIKRLMLDVKWIEDVINNGYDYLYPPYVKKYMSWK